MAWALARPSVRPERSGAESKGEGWLVPLGRWVRHHRVAAAASVLAPAMAAAALVVYLGVGGTAPEPNVDVSSETGGAMVLETKDGPVVLFGDQGEGM